MESMIKQKLKNIQEQVADLRGPTFSEKWLYWRSTTAEQSTRAATINELEKLCKSFDKLKQNLEQDELTAVKKNLQAQKVDVSEDLIRDTWSYVYKLNFLNKKLILCGDCRNFYYYYQKGNDCLVIWSRESFYGFNFVYFLRFHRIWRGLQRCGSVLAFKEDALDYIECPSSADRQY